MATGKGNTFINDLLKLILNATAIANIADNAASSPLTVLYFSLHTGTLSASSSQTTSEAAYTSYARTSVNRNSGGAGFTASSAQTSSPQANVVFPTATGGSETETYTALGTAVSGAGKILWFGTVTPNIVVANGAIPTLTTATTITEA